MQKNKIIQKCLVRIKTIYSKYCSYIVWGFFLINLISFLQIFFLHFSVGFGTIIAIIVSVAAMVIFVSLLQWKTRNPRRVQIISL